jgi:hypothetical protein
VSITLDGPPLRQRRLDAVSRWAGRNPAGLLGAGNFDKLIGLVAEQGESATTSR